jgi:hypothetical protein
MFCELSRHVHGTKRVLKAAMFSRGIDPTGALQLINVTQSLHPRGVDKRFFGYFGFVQRYGELNVTVDGVRDQRSSLVFGVGELRHEFVRFQRSTVRSTDHRSFAFGFGGKLYQEFLD